MTTSLANHSSASSAKATALPPLNYSLHTRHRSIAIVWIALITITCIQVEVLYFALRYGAHKDEGDALEIPTAILLALSVLSIIYRTWHLMWRGSKRRPLSAT